MTVSWVFALMIQFTVRPEWEILAIGRYQVTIGFHGYQPMGIFPLLNATGGFKCVLT